MTRTSSRPNSRNALRFRIQAAALAVAAVVLLCLPPRTFAINPYERYDVNGLTLGMRHSEVQRNLGFFAPNPNEAPTFSVSTRDWAAPTFSFWQWHLTAGALPKSNDVERYLPGLVFGLHADGDPLPADLSSFYTRWSDWDIMNKGYQPCESREYGRQGRTGGVGLKWVVPVESFSTPYPWYSWTHVYTDIELLPMGTMVGLTHSLYGNQGDLSGTSHSPFWLIPVNNSYMPLILDPRPSFTVTNMGSLAEAVMYVLGFDIMYGGDGGLDQKDGQGFYWYEKVAPPMTRWWYPSY